MDDDKVLYDGSGDEAAEAGGETPLAGAKRNRDDEGGAATTVPGGPKRTRLSPAPGAAAASTASFANGCPVPISGPLASLLFQPANCFSMGTTYDVAAAAKSMASNSFDVTAKAHRKLAWVMELAGMAVRPLFPPVAPAPAATSAAGGGSDGAAASAPLPPTAPAPSLPYLLAPAPWVEADRPAAATGDASDVEEGGAPAAAARDGQAAAAAAAPSAASPSSSSSAAPAAAAGGAVSAAGPGAKKQIVDDAHVPTLVKLLHGSVLGVDKIRAKFRCVSRARARARRQRELRSCARARVCAVEWRAAARIM